MDALLELFWKSSLVLCGAAFAALLARRASAATRHLIWAAALAGGLALPVGSALLPRVRVAALPAGLDPCDLLVQEGPEPFRAALTNAVDVLEFKLNLVLSSATATSVA